MTRLTPVAAIFTALALTACSGGSDAPPPMNETVESIEVIDETPSENLAMPEPEPTPSASPTPIVEDDRLSEEQVLDDAESVGMTARIPRDSSDETAPTD